MWLQSKKSQHKEQILLFCVVKWEGRLLFCFYIFSKTTRSNSTKMYYSKHRTTNGKPVSGKEGRKRRKRQGTCQKELSGKYFPQQCPRIVIRSAFAQKEEWNTDYYTIQKLRTCFKSVLLQIFSLIPKSKRSHTDPEELVTISEICSSSYSLIFK